MSSGGEAAVEQVGAAEGELGSKEQVHARALAREPSTPAKQRAPQQLRGGSPPHDAPDSPELDALLKRPPFSLADFRKPIPTRAERLQQDVERAASNDPTLVRVHWERTGATDEDLARLAAALSSNTHVRTLHLEGNPAIRDADEAAGLTALETVLSSGHTAVTTVHLAGTGVGDGRTAALGQLCTANALRCVKANDPTLRELVFCGTGVGDDVAAALAEALPGNTVLETIRFGSAGSDRHMTDTGATHLQSALPQCGVVTLTLGFTSVSAEKVRALHTLCVANACRRLRANDEQLVRLSWRNLTPLSADEALTDEHVSSIAAALVGNTVSHEMHFPLNQSFRHTNLKSPCVEQVLRSIDLWGNAEVSDKSAALSSTSSKGLASCLQSSAVEWVRLDWTAVSAAGKEAVRNACVENAAANPEHAELFAGLGDGSGGSGDAGTP